MNKYKLNDRIKDRYGFTGTITDISDKTYEITWDISGCCSDNYEQTLYPICTGDDNPEIQEKIHKKIFRR